MASFTSTAAYSSLSSLSSGFTTDHSLHLRNLLLDATRSSSLTSTHSSPGHDVIFDYSRQHVDGKTMDLLFDLAEERGLQSMMRRMYDGEVRAAHERREERSDEDCDGHEERSDEALQILFLLS